METAEAREATQLADAPGSRRAPRWALPLFILIAATLSILVGGQHGDMFTLPDSDAYLQMANGQGRLVPQPYTSRQLAPLIVRRASNLLHTGVEQAFIGLGVLSILILAGLVGHMLLRSGASAFLLTAVAGISFWSSLFNGLVLPDLWVAALLGIFLYFLFQARFLAAALMLLPLAVSRESTLLVLICFLVAGWGRMRLIHFFTALASTIAGMAIVKVLTAGGLANNEHLGFVAYMAGKIVWNFLYNVAGLQLYSNTSNNNSCTIPQWQWAVHIGGIRQMGICGFQPARILCTLRTALACFGLFPLMGVYLWRRSRGLKLPQSVLLRFAVVYGLLCFLLAPELGPSIARLFGYAWPLFVVAVPLLARDLRLSPRAAIALLALHLGASWAVWILGFKMMSLPAESALLAGVLCAYVAGWALLNSAVAPLPPDAATTTGPAGLATTAV